MSGSFTFKWSHPADEVFVTGAFDNWTKSVQLTKQPDNTFEKAIALPHNGEKIFYKFVADGVWKHDHTAKTETDEHGNVNNVIEPSDIVDSPPSSTTPFISSVAPGATTTESDEMAKGKNNNKKKSQAAKAAAKTEPSVDNTVQDSTPGAFPETPLETPAAEETVSVAPIPASEGAGNPISLEAGEKVPEPSSINANTIESTVHDDPELKSAAEAAELDQTVSVAPIPATGGTGNPISLAPGETVPDASTITANTVDSTVKLDQNSYEKSDAGASVLPVVAGAGTGLLAGGALGGALSGLGHQTSNIIPESSLPMGKDMPADISSENVGPTISSVAPQSTTAQLAGAVPLENKEVAPAIVNESQKEADVSPEASANPVAVEEKEEMEKELQSKVPEVPAISSVAAESSTAELAGAVPLENKEVAPAIVTESQKEADVSPEASANPTAVEEKQEMEKELQSKVPEVPAISSVAAESTTTELAGAVPLENKEVEPAAPAIVTESQKEADVSPEASANPVAVEEKGEMEKELQSKVPEVPAISSVAAESTTTELAGAVPLEKDSAPVDVSESQQETPVTTSAANDTAETTQTSPIDDAKKAFDGKNDGSIAGIAAGGVAAAGVAAAGTAYALRDKTTEATGKDPVSYLPESVQNSIQDMNQKSATEPTTTSATPTLSTAAATTNGEIVEPTTTNGETVERSTTNEVPAVVTESQEKAQVDPEASAVASAVQEKQAMENELLKKVPESEAQGNPAPSVTAATSSTAPAATTEATTEAVAEATTEATPEVAKAPSSVAPAAVAGVAGAGVGVAGALAAAESKSSSGAPQLADPTAGVGALSMDNKESASTGLNAPADAPASTSKALPVVPKDVVDSRDVSPMSKPTTAGQTEPTVTTGVASSTTAVESKPVGTPRTNENSTPVKRNSIIDKLKGTPESSKKSSTESPAVSSGTKEKRKSFFGRLKEKFTK